MQAGADASRHGRKQARTQAGRATSGRYHAAVDGQAKQTARDGALATGGLLAGPVFALALAGFAARLPGFHHALHPPALLGATGVPGATAWNFIGFGLAGVLALLGTLALDRAVRRDGAGAVARVGTTLLLLSTLAFAAQGLLPLELGRPIDVGPGRLHVAAFTTWWIAASAGLMLLAPGLAALPRWRGLVPVALGAAVLVLVFLHADVPAIAPGWRQRWALGAWFGWVAWASWRTLRLSRSAT